MAVFTRTNGNAQTVVSVSNTALSAETNGVAISTGIGKPVLCLGYTANATMASQMGTNEAVEILLRQIGQVSTLLCYQVDATRLSVMIEECDQGALTQANANAALSAGGYGNLVISAITDLGFKLAAS